jgi:hypothetical protein
VAHHQQFGDRLGFGDYPLYPEVAGQQVAGVGLGQYVQIEQMSAMQS